jgi:2-dehydro-3-deoxyglucarate aldolase/4-hydroxy-2-oxoheptanedioate aldolase
MSAHLKAKLSRGETVLGQMVLEFFTPGMAQMMDRCGLEFCIYDMEHGRCDISVAAQMIASCNGTGVTPMVRVPDLTSAPLSRLLDLGARGIMVPRVETGAQMRDIVAQLKYAPDGRRGVALCLTHDQFCTPDPNYFARANAETMVIALIETARGFENLDDILSTPGLDVAWMGHYDLTVSMGIPAQFDHPLFLNAMDRLVDRSRHYGVAAGFLPGSPRDAAHWIGKGFRMVSLGSDIGVYLHGLRQFCQAAQAAPVEVEK